MLDAGLWILDEIMNVFSSIQHRASSSASPQAMLYLPQQLVGLRQSFAREFHKVEERIASLKSE